MTTARWSRCSSGVPSRCSQYHHVVIDNHSVRFFDAQFKRQVAQREFGLNSFEQLALEHLRGDLLDLGCGLGNLALEAARGGHRVVALDASPTAIARIRQVAREEGLDLDAREVDLSTSGVAGEYDTVVCIGLLMFLQRDHALAVLGQLQRAVRPGGQAIVNVLTAGTTFFGMFDPRGYHLFGPNELERSFTGWHVLVAQRDEFPAPEGTRKVFSTIVARRRS